MTEVLWTLPVPSTALLESPDFQKLIGRTCALILVYEDEESGQVSSLKLLVKGVEAFHCTYDRARTVAMFEAYYKAGFSIAWWEMITYSVILLVALSGWVVYRYRQTRALTLAQLLEIRYSRRFRIFAGIVMFISGLLNY